MVQLLRSLEQARFCRCSADSTEERSLLMGTGGSFPASKGNGLPCTKPGAGVPQKSAQVTETGLFSGTRAQGAQLGAAASFIATRTPGHVRGDGV